LERLLNEFLSMKELNSKVKIIAVFDFDGTIIKGDTMFIFHKLLNNKISRILNYIKLFPFYVMYIFKIINLIYLKEKFYRIIIKPVLISNPKKNFDKILSDQLSTLIRNKIKINAKKRIEWHLRNDHKVIIISASPRQLIEKVANDLGVELIATETNLQELIKKNSPNYKFCFTSKNCKGKEKVIRLKNYIKDSLDDYIIYAYGDSEGDRELLQFADYSYLNNL